MENVTVLTELGVLILAGLTAAFIVSKIKLPAILGYLLAGVILAFATDNSQNTELISSIAQIGAAMLLFTIGVEFSLDFSSKDWRVFAMGAVTQGVLTLLLGLVLLPLLGFGEYESFFIAALVSMSSTAFVFAMLEQAKLLSTRAGTVSLGWLVVQDLMVIVWFLLLASHAPVSEFAPDLITLAFKAVLLIGGTYLVGKYLMPLLLREVVRMHSDEFLLIFVVAIIILFSLSANFLGLTVAVGAYLAGLSLADSKHHHKIFSEVKPLRDLFTMIFFVSVGTLLNFEIIWNNALPIIFILLVLIPGKIIITVVINLWFKTSMKDALRVGLAIAQIGEFALLISQTGLGAEWISIDIYNIVVTSTIISMLCTPWLYANIDGIYHILENLAKNRAPGLYRSLFLAKDEISG